MENMTQTTSTQINGSVVEHKKIEQLLTFILGEETYGIDILRVQEIRGWEKTTNIPGVPDYVKGVINIRGTVVPIVDLRDRFHIGEMTFNESTVVIITKMESGNRAENLQKTVGLVVDGVSDVEDVDMNTLQNVPSFQSGTHVSAEFIHGLASMQQKMVIVLDVDRLLHQGIFQHIPAIEQ